MDQAYYRGGRDLTPKPRELRIDPATGLVEPNRGISLNNDPAELTRFGGAYRVRSVPAELEIVQHGKNLKHFELRPRQAMTPARYLELLEQVQLDDQPTT